MIPQITIKKNQTSINQYVINHHLCLKIISKPPGEIFRKNKLFSAINILGLSIGIAMCFIIMLYVQDELSYDRFNKNADNIARIVFNANINGGKINESIVMAPVAQTMKKDFPEVQDATRLAQTWHIKNHL